MKLFRKAIWWNRIFINAWMLVSCISAFVISEIAEAQNGQGVGIVSSNKLPQAPVKSMLCASAAELADTNPTEQEGIARGDRLVMHIRDVRLKRGFRLQQAIQGDMVARLEIAHEWADCIVEQQSMSDAQKQTALEWLENAATAGDRESASRLGLIFASGKGVAQNYNEAYRWYKLSNTSLTSEAVLIENKYGLALDEAERQAAYTEAVRQELRNADFLFVSPREMRSSGPIKISVRLRFTNCSRHVNIDAISSIDQARIDHAEEHLSAILAIFPQTGIPCEAKNSQPIQWQLPYTFDRPANNALIYSPSNNHI